MEPEGSLPHSEASILYYHSRKILPSKTFSGIFHSKTLCVFPISDAIKTNLSRCNTSKCSRRKNITRNPSFDELSAPVKILPFWLLMWGKGQGNRIKYVAPVRKSQRIWLRDFQNATLSNVYWTVHHCNTLRMKDQLDVTCYFISLLKCSTCFGH